LVVSGPIRYLWVMVFRLKKLALVLVVAAGLGPAAVPAWAAEGALKVVELFTSQGCSSCPPADALLAEIADREDVLALSFHIDYWDYIGWKDPFASPLFTRRQEVYRQVFGNRYVYTPQMVVNGTFDMTGTDRASALERIAAAPPPDRVNLTMSDDGAGKLTVSIPQSDAADPATVWLVVYDNEHVTAVKRGENRGRTIRNRNVVRGIQRIGMWQGQALELPVMISELAPDGGDICAVLLQSQRTGRILAAARMALIPAP
jgi:hypothetical protein